MRKLVVVLNIIIALYFFALANFLFWVSVLAIFFGAFIKQELLTNPLLLFINMLFAPFLIYGTITFFRKTESKYNYGLVLLFIIWAGTQINRFFFVTNNKLEMVDLSNLLFFGIPFSIIYLTRYLNRKYVSGN
ncbi:MAG: hypothetical protein LiPW31_189 [Microgenomates group bacterium LiPW_31]|nr:MAG: hypothetical protein LiPW31_189 [Microgenomates group bacterium LiPW_31]